MKQIFHKLKLKYLYLKPNYFRHDKRHIRLTFLRLIHILPRFNADYLETEANMQKFFINDLYSQYKNGAIGRTDFEGLLYQNLAGSKSKFVSNLWTRDEYDDFISWMYPRIHNAIDNYKATGASFEVYLATIIRVAAREYRVRRITENVTEYAVWTIRVPEQYANEEAPVYLPDSNKKPKTKAPPPAAATVKKRNNPRQLLMLALKCYRYMSDDFIGKIARKTGIKRDKLTEMISQIREIRVERDAEIYLMRERVYSQFYRCIVYEKRLAFLPENSPAAITMKQRGEKARKRLEGMRERLASIRTDPTNRQVAQVMGISKGSVDSGLYALKTKLNLSEGKSLLN
jgi:DNA-directed RNA polymerase specialized sigma24 family protein